MNKSKDILDGNIKEVLTKLTLPMIFGIMGIVAFNLADTYFVGKLGTAQIAALTFTFPVVLVINSINLGLGVGTSALISKTIGENNIKLVKRLATDSLSLSFLIAVLFFIIGEITINPVFKMLGADEQTMVYVRGYMKIWYMGSPFIVIPMVGNSIIRALGDTKTPSYVMIFSAVINILLDPIMIFGLGPIPAMGVTGAALATLIGRSFTFIFSLYVLIYREKVIEFEKISVKEMIESWKKILHIGVPNAVAKMIIPIGTGIITGMIASYGKEIVAGYGIASRIEFLALAVVSALASVIPVFVGQNYGAKKIDRIREGIKMSCIFSVFSGLIVWGILSLTSPYIYTYFTDNVEVGKTFILYLKIVPIGYTFQGVIQIVIGGFNGTSQPFKASILNVIQMFIVYVPLAKILSVFMGFQGILISIVISQILVGILGNIIFEKSLNKMKISVDTL